MFFVRQLLCLTAAFLVTPSVPAITDCTCPAADNCQDFMCADAASTSCTITWIHDGQCSQPPSCTTPNTCKWVVSMSLTTYNNHDIQTFISGSQRSVAHDSHMVSIDDLDWRIACNVSNTLALGYDNQPCIEAEFDCDGCTGG